MATRSPGARPVDPPTGDLPHSYREIVHVHRDDAARRPRAGLTAQGVPPQRPRPSRGQGAIVRPSGRDRATADGDARAKPGAAWLVVAALLAGCARAVAPACDGCVLRPMAPLSTATVTSRRPTLHWAPGQGFDGVRVELCRDRACTEPLATLDATGSSAAPTSDLPTGVVFWRLRGRNGTRVDDAVTATWQFTVGARSAAVDTSWGTTPDVNGDGFADVIVGDLPRDHSGHVYVYLGSSSGPSTVPAMDLSDGQPLFGFVVASAGDVDGDGFGDVAISTGSLEYHDPTSVVIYRGGPQGLTRAGVILEDPSRGDHVFGTSVTGLGDVNGDGYGDLGVGAYQSTVPGAVFIFGGSHAGLSETPAFTIPYPHTQYGSLFGRVASAGDLDGDGYGDTVVSAPGLPDTTGYAFVYHGGPTGPDASRVVALSLAMNRTWLGTRSMALNAGDLNGDGRADLVAFDLDAPDFDLPVLSSLDVYLGGSRRAPAPDASLVVRDGTDIASAGDVDGDGLSDLLVRLSRSTGMPTPAELLHFSTDGLAIASSVILTSPFACDDYTIGGLGDVNGDGLADVAVSGFRPTNLFVYPGDSTRIATTPAVVLPGADDDFGYSFALHPPRASVPH